MIDDKDDFRGTTAVSLDGEPIAVGEITGISAYTPSGRHLFDVGKPVSPQVDGIRDWRDKALLRILAELKAMRRIDEEPSEEVASTATAGDGWLGVEEVAAYLNLTPKTVREGAAKGTLPGHKYPADSIRGRWRFKKDELDRKLNKRSGSSRRAVEETVWN